MDRGYDAGADNVFSSVSYTFEFRAGANVVGTISRRGAEGSSGSSGCTFDDTASPIGEVVTTDLDVLGQGVAFDSVHVSLDHYGCITTNRQILGDLTIEGGSCPATVDSSCRTGFSKGFLLVREILGKENVIAKFLNGPALDQTDMDNPLAGGTATIFTLCVYDQNDDLAGTLKVDRAGGACDGKPCWKSLGKKPPDPAGKGPNIPSGIPTALQSSTQATIQLRASDGVCLSAPLTDVKKNAPNFYKIK